MSLFFSCYLFIVIMSILSSDMSQERFIVVLSARTFNRKRLYKTCTFCANVL